MESEIVKLINVLRRIARAAGYAAWVKPEPEASRFCVTQYNKVLKRLGEIEPSVAALFAPLTEDAAPEVVRIAARELAAYFEDEAPELHGFQFAFGCSPRRMRGRAQSGCRPVTVHCE